MFSEHTPRASIPDTRIPQFMPPCPFQTIRASVFNPPPPKRENGRTTFYKVTSWREKAYPTPLSVVIFCSHNKSSRARIVTRQKKRSGTISGSSIVGKTRRLRRHVCAIFQACCAIFFASGHNFYFFCILLWKFTYKLDVSHPINLGVVKHAFQWYFTLFWGKFRIIVSMLFLCVSFLSAIFLHFF